MVSPAALAVVTCPLATSRRTASRTGPACRGSLLAPARPRPKRAPPSAAMKRSSSTRRVSSAAGRPRLHVGEQRRADQPERRDGDRAADAEGDPGGHGLHQQAAGLGVGGQVGDPLAEPGLGHVAQRDRLLELDVEPLVAAEEDGEGPQQAAQALLGLLAAGELVQVGRRLDQPLVVDGDRHEEHVVGGAVEPGVHLHRDQPHLREEQLAGPAAPALDVELLRETVAQQLLHVGAQHRGVDLVALHLPADEEGAAAPGEGCRRARRRG